MISIEQWREAIGCFCPRRRDTRRPSPGLKMNSCSASLCLRLVLALSLAIVISGDVETNPGPATDQQILKELRDMRTSMESQLKNLNGDLVSLKRGFHNKKYEIDRMKDAIRD